MYKRLANFSIFIFPVFFLGIMLFFIASNGIIGKLTGDQKNNTKTANSKVTSKISDSKETQPDQETTSNVKGVSTKLQVTGSDFWNCSEDLYDCEDLSFSQAQAILEYCSREKGDLHNLDLNNDGIACLKE